jgi:DNA-binding MarR family transcriptional regulator/GNAT superfamily N-acetyltransferase
MKTQSPRKQRVAVVRRFNRFYTRQIGLLRKSYLDSPFSLGETRVLYDLFHSRSLTASDLGRNLDLDAGYLSRVLSDFEKRGLVKRTTAANDARQSYISLSPRGRQTFTPLERRSEQSAMGLLDRLDGAAQERLVAAMDSIEALLEPKVEAKKNAKPAYILRAPRPGDFGWIVKRHAEIYAQEYGWTEPFEALCAQIVLDFLNKNDSKYERCWIAEFGGENVGTVMMVKDSDDVARLRLLLVDPKGRGLGLGTRLVDESIKFAREAGYKKVTLWTHSVLTAARKIYQNAGFTLTSSEKRHTWSRDVVAEFWDMAL